MECVAIEFRQNRVRPHGAKRLPHSGAGIILSDLAMTARADGRVHISGIDTGGQERLRLALAVAEGRGNTQQNDRNSWFSSPDREHRLLAYSFQRSAFSFTA